MTASLEGRRPQRLGRILRGPRGACHRAGHFGPDPLARAPQDDGKQASILVLAARLGARVMSKRSREARRRGAKKKAGAVPAFDSSLKPASLVLHPDFHPGYANKKGSGTPTSAVVGRHPRHAGRCCHRPRASGAARLSAFHHGSRLGDRTPPLSSSTALPELVPVSGRYP